ncbi:ribonuclease H-like domain-containing protein, partial [Amanita rubescens]
MSERSRRDVKSKLDKLAEYKRAREGGGRTIKEQDVAIYDEVSEDQYKSIVRGRLQKDDFIVDDGISGYMDNGMEDWMEEDQQDESEEEYDKKRKKTKKGKDTSSKGKGKDASSKGKAKAKPEPSVEPSINAYRPKVSAEAEADFMSNLLGAIDSQPSPATGIVRSRKRKPSPVQDTDSGPSSPGPIDYDAFRAGPSYEDRSSDVEELMAPSSDDHMFSPKKRIKVDSGAATPAMERLAQLDFNSGSDADMTFDEYAYDDIDMDAFMDIDEDLKRPAVKKKPVDIQTKQDVFNNTGTRKAKLHEGGTPAWLSVYDSLSTTTSDTLEPLASASTSTTVKDASVLEPDGSLRFFWLDYLELDGKIYFTGKLRDKVTGAWLSCCVTIEGLQRNLFALPREKIAEQDEDGNLVDTDVVPSLEDVYNDFDMIRKQLNIKSWKAKFVKRKYAFGEKKVPRGESQWLKVVYGFNEPQIPTTACSPSIEQIFGTNTTAFELLVMKRKIMGPCWLQIKHPKIENQGISWCKVEAVVSNPKDINPFSETDSDAPKDLPPLTVMNLSVRTIVNHKENQREIVCITSRIWHNMNIDDPTPPDKLPCTVQTFVRPLDQFPPNFEARAKANGKGTISPAKNERMLLNTLLSAVISSFTIYNLNKFKVSIFKADPDVIIGHEFLSVSLDVLLHRMRELKADHWSRLGRFRRSKWPSIGRQGSNMRFLNGRLLCDLASDSAKSMMPSTTWSLTEMCKTHLKIERQDIDPEDTVTYFDGNLSSADHLLTFVRHCELDAHLQMAIAAKVQILPLTRQLTNLAGNAWNKTLNGGRAERNEYILLHEFHRLKYICPDKLWGKKAVTAEKVEKVDAQDDEEKYKGGLVFEPKKGLHDKYILVMDFNSLYPSIIQEWNIDFTTVQSIEEEDEHGEEKIPDPPSSDIAQGVLPRLIATLVSRRRQVKSLMKDKTLPHAKLLQYDIKQQALKLTANSMYGCLGFEYSRFYARPLAALTTFKGREILTHTRELAESL